jgi:alpha-beta hydrolase superfamily lysophospholipase
MAISQLPAIFILSLAMISCGDRSSRTSADFKKSDPRNEVQTMSEKNPLQDERVASAIFFPRPDMPYGPEAPGVRDHFFESEDGARLRLRLFMEEKHGPVILFFHGNGETARDYDPVASEYRVLGASFIVAEYRGYGPCTGQPSVNTFLADAHQTFDELKNLLKKKGRKGPIVIMGRSLGSAPAIELAASRPGEIAGLVIESGFARIVPLLALIGLRVRELGITEDHGPRNLKKMGTIALPTLIIHAENDEIIPISDAELLHEANRDEHKVFFRVSGAGHNDIQFRAGAAYFDHIRRFLDRVRFL